jgi:molybdate transport system substrate-binding protein
VTSARIAAAVGVLVAAAVAIGLTGCATPATSPAPATTEARLEGAVTVFAAASLRGTFTELAEQFESAHPDTTIELNFAGSADLVTQLIEGAPADVFASADQKNMTKLADAGLVEGEPADFATNVLEIAVPPDNPAGIETFADLAAPGVKLVICAPEVPCGAATAEVERAGGITLSPVSEESSVTDVLGKVLSGEADAGLIYVTDVIAAGDAVEGIAFTESAEAVNTYPIAALADAEAPDAAAAFVAFVAGGAGQAVLSAAGFGRP